MTRHIPAAIFHALEIVSHSSSEEILKLVPRQLSEEASELVSVTNSWAQDQGIQGFGISKKMTGGEWTNLDALVVYVEKKRVRVSRKLRIPPEIKVGSYGNVVTDVVEIGKIELCNSNQERHRPAFNGCSIGHSDKSTGSIGSVFQNNGVNMVLSSGHVLAPSGAEIGDSLRQPGYQDQGDSRDEVARLSYFTELNSGSEYINAADVGIAEESVPNTFIQDAVSLSDYTFARRRLRVRFSGRSTQYSTGEVLGVHFRGRFNIRGQFIAFGRQIITTCPSSKGDSGALLRTNFDRPVGLLLGGSARGSVFNPIYEVVRQLNSAN